jgi:hypothetical protein
MVATEFYCSEKGGFNLRDFLRARDKCLSWGDVFFSPVIWKLFDIFLRTYCEENVRWLCIAARYIMQKGKKLRYVHKS